MSNPYTKDEINAYRAEPVVVAGTGMFDMRRWLDTVAFLDERGARLTGERARLSARVAKLEALLSDIRDNATSDIPRDIMDRIDAALEAPK